MKVKSEIKNREKKLCFVASSGGHWEELMCLRKIAEENKSFYVTEVGGQAEECCNIGHIYTLPQINRHEAHFLRKFLMLCIESWRILKIEKPDAIITTGALIAFPLCIIGKIKKVKLVYIESFARIESGSLTGKLVYKFADLFLVQWESLLKIYPKAKYVGGIF